MCHFWHRKCHFWYQICHSDVIFVLQNTSFRWVFLTSCSLWSKWLHIWLTLRISITKHHTMSSSAICDPPCLMKSAIKNDASRSFFRSSNFHSSRRIKIEIKQAYAVEQVRRPKRIAKTIENSSIGSQTKDGRFIYYRPAKRHFLCNLCDGKPPRRRTRRIFWETSVRQGTSRTINYGIRRRFFWSFKKIVLMSLLFPSRIEGPKESSATL